MNRVFVAGGSGTIGVPLVRALVAAGHHVTAMTRSPRKRASLAALGAEVAIADALNRDELAAAVEAARPTHVIHELTALPKDGPRRASDVAATNRLRVDGTRHLLEAALRARVGRFVVGSFAMLSPRASDTAPPSDAAAVAVGSMEEQVIAATRGGAIDGIILRYGMFYGPDVPSTRTMIDQVRKRRLPAIRGDAGRLPLIHLDDAVSATVRALEAGVPGTAYDIVDDRPASLTEIVTAIAEYTGAPAPWRVPAWLPRLVAPYMARLTTMQLPLSNARAKTELGWQPRYPTLDHGLARLATRAA